MLLLNSREIKESQYKKYFIKEVLSYE